MKNFLVPAFAVVLTLALSTTSEAQTDSLAADHAANIAAGIGAMQNPLPSTHGGQWTFYAVGDAQNAPTVVATDGDVGAGVGIGWNDPGQGIGGFGQVEHTVWALVPVTVLCSTPLVVVRLAKSITLYRRPRLTKSN